MASSSSSSSASSTPASSSSTSSSLSSDGLYYCDAIDMFNLPLFECYLVIDTRARAVYDANHILSAQSLPWHESADEVAAIAALHANATDTKAPDVIARANHEHEAQLLQFVMTLTDDGLTPEQWSPLIVYGDDSPSCHRAAVWLTTRLKALQAQARQLTIPKDRTPVRGGSVMDEDEDGTRRDYDPFREFCVRLAQCSTSVWSLRGGYASFAAQYPFMVGHGTAFTLATAQPTPHHLTLAPQCVYLGSRAVRVTRDALQPLGVTHMVVARQFSDAHMVDGIAYLRCDVPDQEETPSAIGRQSDVMTNDYDMTACFDATIAFINHAHTTGGRVMIQLHGRSRSAGLAMAWVMHQRGWPFDRAYEFVKLRSPRIDPSLVFAPQLRKRERLQLASSSSSTPALPPPASPATT